MILGHLMVNFIAEQNTSPRRVKSRLNSGFKQESAILQVEIHDAGQFLRGLDSEVKEYL